MGRTRVHVVVTNRTCNIIGPYPYDELIPYWSYSVPNFHHIMQYKPWFRRCKVCGKFKIDHDKHTEHDFIPQWDGKIRLLKNDRMPAGLFWATRSEIESKTKVRFQVSKGLMEPTGTDQEEIRSKDEYEFQNECADRMVTRCRYGGGLILNATGSGKTRVAAMLASRVGSDILFVVDELHLLRQARKAISRELGESVGFVGESKFKLRRVTCATIQTLHLHREDPKFLRWFKRVQIIIIDEVHVQINRSNFDVVNIAKPLAVFGLTATLALSKKPIRLRAYSLAGPVIYEYPLRKGMEEGVLSKGISILLRYDNSIAETIATDSSEVYEKRLVANNERNHIIARLVKRSYKLGKYTFVLVERLKHLEEVSDRLKKVPHKIVAGSFKGKGIDVAERIKHTSKFEKGKVRVIIASKVFKKGVDVKRLDVIINAAGKSSVNDAIQIFGRGVRRHKNKKGLIHIDMQDTDKYDAERSHYNQHRNKDRDRKLPLNWLAQAAKKRKKAMKKAGIKTYEFVWEKDGTSKDLFRKGEVWLTKETKQK